MNSYLICLNFELAKSLFKLNYVPQKYECVFILNFCDKWSMRVLQVLYPHILIYKDALLFCINIWHYVLKEYLWFLIWIIILFKLADLHESWMVPLTISCDGSPVWNLICNKSLYLIMKGLFYCLITFMSSQVLKVYKVLFFKKFLLNTFTHTPIHLHTDLQKLFNEVLYKFSWLI